ncbi:vWA domain-containing protein [Streptomyces spiralis]
MSDPVELATRFCRVLRAEGLAVGTGQIIDFCRAAAELGELYWAGLATLVSDREEIAVYDRVFRAFFSGHESMSMPEPQRDAPAVMRTAHTAGLADPSDEDADQQVAMASHVELLRKKSFADCTEDELHTLFAVGARLPVATRRSRRYRAARKGSPDFQRTLRASFRTGAEPVRRAWRVRRLRPRRVVLLLDVSGSMAAYSRALLFFAHAGVRAQRGWEVFCFGTRLTRVTRELAQGTPDEALRRAAEEVVDWDGGTRIGDSLKRFLDGYGHGGLARGAWVVVCSDGLEFGDPELLGQQMLRLSRLAHRVVWLNPLKEDPAYEPLVRGMQAALPHIDVFSSGHNLAGLVEGLAGAPGPR